MIGVIVAMEKEAKHFVDFMTEKEESFEAGKKVYKGFFNDKKCVLIISGIGKVSSAMASQYIIDKYNPEYLLNFGTTGAIDSNMNIGDVYFVKKGVQYDFDLTEIDDVERGYNQDYDTVFFECKNQFTNSNKMIGVLATADKFSNNEDEIKYLQKIGCNLKDMEGTSICQVALSNNCPLIMIKGVSDVYGKGLMTSQYIENVHIASKKLFEFIKEII